MDYVHSENKAEQTFYNGFNVGHLKLALGDVNLCNATPGCVPLDLFGGEGRPITPAMFDYISTDQHDASKQVLDLINANITGDLFAIGDGMVRAPTLMVWGENDVAISIECLDGTGDYVPDLEIVRLPGISHWVQQDAPEAVNAAMTDWLDRLMMLPAWADPWPERVTS